MSAVEVPAELIERAAEVIESQRIALCGEFHSASVGEMLACSKGDCPERLAQVDELRALLPQPAPTCPNCGHLDADHTLGNDEDFRAGCYFDTEAAPGVRCDCALTRHALPQVRALLAAERDSKPTPAKPRAWKAGDPDPEDVEQIQDRDGDVWTRRTDGWWSSPETREMTWEHIARKWSPLTEVFLDSTEPGTDPSLAVRRPPLVETLAVSDVL